MRIDPKLWTPLKGYEGHYWINSKAQVCNRKGHILKPCSGSNLVEVRKNGQRELIDPLEVIGCER